MLVAQALRLRRKERRGRAIRRQGRGSSVSGYRHATFRIANRLHSHSGCGTANVSVAAATASPNIAVVMRTRRTFLIISQVYPPDPAAIGQHLEDVAKELVRRGNRVIVYTADHGYDDPSAAYEPRETRDGVEVRRVPLSSFGKSSIPVRLLGGGVFVAQVIVRAAFTRR